MFETHLYSKKEFIVYLKFKYNQCPVFYFADERKSSFCQEIGYQSTSTSKGKDVVGIHGERQCENDWVLLGRLSQSELL